MKIALYSRLLKTKDISFIQHLIDLLFDSEVELWIHEHYHAQLVGAVQLKKAVAIFTDDDLLKLDIDFLFSIGGDGTLLDTVTIIRDSQIPILGINIGRLGLLTNAAQGDMQEVLAALFRKDYFIDKRSLIYLDSKEKLFGNNNFALNEFTIHKKDTSSMITIHTFVDGEFLNSYWADGIIVATATGSTAYSLSCGGPIIAPSAKTFIITPVAPHNLSVRPLVISDEQAISFKIEGRSEHFLCTLDSRYATIDANAQLSLKKANFTLNLIRLKGTSFFTTIRNKLMWGLDSRN